MVHAVASWGSGFRVHGEENWRPAGARQKAGKWRFRRSDSAVGSPTAMRFRLLGPLEVRDGDMPVRLAAGKQRALMADLLLNANRAVPLAQLVDDLWGERVPDTAVKALQVYVSKLRKALPRERLHTSGAGYLLEVGEDELDLDEFLRLSAEGRAAL